MCNYVNHKIPVYKQIMSYVYIYVYVIEKAKNSHVLRINPNKIPRIKNNNKMLISRASFKWWDFKQLLYFLLFILFSNFYLFHDLQITC